MSDLLLLPGSLRAASASRATARALAERLKDRVSCTIVDVGKLPHYNADLTDDPDVAGFISQIKAARGVVFVTPEYNYSLPGVLKNAIDWASRPAFASVFKGKPCFVVSVSGGALGGVRAQAHLKYVLGGMLADLPAAKEVVIPLANDKVTDGILTDEAVLSFAMAEMEGFLGRLG